MPTGPLLSAALAVFVVSATLIPMIGHGSWLPATSADTGTGSETVVALTQARSAMAAADDAMQRGQAEAAARELATSQARLDRAEHAFERDTAPLAGADRATLERALRLAAEAQQVREAHLDWQTALAADQRSLASAETVAERAEALAEAEATVKAGEDVVDRRQEHREALASFARSHPSLASSLGLWPTGEAEAVERVQAANEQRRERVHAETVELAFTRTTDEHRQAMEPAARERLAEHNPPELQAHFESFDRNGDGELDRPEAVAFYQWVEDEIQYRHDDENATAEIAGTPVGDGRPGTDHQQTPLETFDERMGDCEDTGALQVAFHRYWGSRAYLALLNTETDGRIDHAAAIVEVGDAPDDVARVEDGFHTYDFREGNELGVRAGTYAIVDNTYSDRFGTITGDVEPGSFQVRDAETLAERLDRADA